MSIDDTELLYGDALYDELCRSSPHALLAYAFIVPSAEECDLSVMLLEARTRSSPKAFLLVCSHNQPIQSKGTCQVPMVNIAMSLKQ